MTKSSLYLKNGEIDAFALVARPAQRHGQEDPGTRVAR